VGVAVRKEGKGAEEGYLGFAIVVLLLLGVDVL
jgi:hypothetical protein